MKNNLAEVLADAEQFSRQASLLERHPDLGTPQESRNYRDLARGASETANEIAALQDMHVSADIDAVLDRCREAFGAVSLARVLIEECVQAGVRLRVEGGTLLASPAALVTADLKKRIAAQRDHLKALLSPVCDGEQQPDTV